MFKKVAQSLATAILFIMIGSVTAFGQFSPIKVSGIVSDGDINATGTIAATGTLQATEDIYASGSAVITGDITSESGKFYGDGSALDGTVPTLEEVVGEGATASPTVYLQTLVTIDGAIIPALVSTNGNFSGFGQFGNNVYIDEGDSYVFDYNTNAVTLSYSTPTMTLGNSSGDVNLDVDGTIASDTGTSTVKDLEVADDLEIGGGYKGGSGCTVETDGDILCTGKMTLDGDLDPDNGSFSGQVDMASADITGVATAGVLVVYDGAATSTISGGFSDDDGDWSLTKDGELTVLSCVGCGGGGGGSQTLAQTLVAGNSAGASSIDMASNTITNFGGLVATSGATFQYEPDLLGFGIPGFDANLFSAKSTASGTLLMGHFQPTNFHGVGVFGAAGEIVSLQFVPETSVAGLRAGKNGYNGSIDVWDSANNSIFSANNSGTTIGSGGSTQPLTVYGDLAVANATASQSISAVNTVSAATGTFTQTQYNGGYDAGTGAEIQADGDIYTVGNITVGIGTGSDGADITGYSDVDANTSMQWNATNGSLTVGTSNTTGSRSATFGISNTNNGTAMLVSGFSNTGGSIYSIIAGSYNSVLHANSAALGYANASGGSNNMMIGYYNAGGWHRAYAFGSYLKPCDLCSANDSMAIGGGVNNVNQLDNPEGSSLVVGFNSDISTLTVGASTGVGTTGKVGIGVSDLNEVDTNDAALIIGENDGTSSYGGISLAFSDAPSDPATNTAILYAYDGSDGTATGELRYLSNINGATAETVLAAP